MRENLRILIADDHDLFRDALMALIREEAPEAIVKAVGSLPSALEELRSGSGFDVAVLDFRMPGMNSLDDAMRVKAEFENTKVVIMSGVAKGPEIMAAFHGGLSGYLPKTMSGRSLLSALTLIISGERYFPPNILVLSQSDVQNQTGLSGREMEVLRKLRTGAANKEIARELGIEETTVKLHLRSLCAKLNAKNRTGLVVQAMAMGLL